MNNVNFAGKNTIAALSFSEFLTLQRHIQLRKIKLTSIFLLLMIAATLSVAGQNEDETPPDVAPPAIRKLTKDEKSKLEAEAKNVKKRTKISLELMDSRMSRAEKLFLETNYKETLDELAGFQAVLDNVLEFLFSTDANDRRFIDFEIYLRKQIPRLETIRREIPYKYGYHVGRLMRSVREARAKAVEPIFADTVIPMAQKKPQNDRF